MRCITSAFMSRAGSLLQGWGELLGNGFIWRRSMGRSLTEMVIR